MTLKEIASAIKDEYPQTSCRMKPKDSQIWLQTELWPDETFVLLSPYYQQRIKDGTFDSADLGGVFIEVDRIHRRGYLPH